MEFIFKTLQYQTDAVDSISDVFKGQPASRGVMYRRDLGSETGVQTTIDADSYEAEDLFTSYRNQDLALNNVRLLQNVRDVQRRNHMRMSDSIVDPLGRITLDIEMETGTGKTYVYTKAMFELYKKYGWSKFIIVVPSVAIREGVEKSISMTMRHFMDEYGNTVMRHFVYDSENLWKIDEFSKNSGINVMIINSQAFSSGFREGGKNKTSRRIYSERDDFASRRPIDVIAANHPILILDEPQKLGKSSSKTQQALRNEFNPLFSMNFSATHTSHHNVVYSLDPVDAYNEKLVKRILVKGVSIRHDVASQPYLYLERIEFQKNGPVACIHMLSSSTGDRKICRLLEREDNLFDESKGLKAYQGLYLTDIDPDGNCVVLNNGTVLHAGEAVGDVTEREMRRIQIRETILSHLDRENILFRRGIKVLSLFFIDKVSNYRVYDDDGNEGLGEYGMMFESELQQILSERRSFYNPQYIADLSKSGIHSVHAGYFSMDRGRAVDSTIARDQEGSSDVSAYELILKNKELLLSYDSPVRFIFSHSALSEGWDNPNVFQICALKHTDSTTRRRQEVGRGMRICVNQEGYRQDFETLGPIFHDVNSLTVVADEDYNTFVENLQKEILPDLRERTKPVTVDAILETVVKAGNEELRLSNFEAISLYSYLCKKYMTEDNRLNEEIVRKLTEDELEDLPDSLAPSSSTVLAVLKALAGLDEYSSAVCDGHRPVIRSNKINANFERPEFVNIWRKINIRYQYRVSLDSEKLIGEAVKSLNSDLSVSGLSFEISEGAQKSVTTYQDTLDGNGFTEAKVRRGTIDDSGSRIKYDLIESIASQVGLTRKTVSRILISMEERKFALFRKNPEEFIKRTSKIINDVKSQIIVDGVRYVKTERRFDDEVFTTSRPECAFANAYKASKNVQDYVFTDSEVEREFARNMDAADEVLVYAKLPDGTDGFFIPTPMGSYTPDWAIVFKSGSIQHVYCVAETKGSESRNDLSPVENGKIRCAEKLFAAMRGDGEDVQFHFVKTYEGLLDKIRSA